MKPIVAYTLLMLLAVVIVTVGGHYLIGWMHRLDEQILSSLNAH